MAATRDSFRFICKGGMIIIAMLSMIALSQYPNVHHQATPKSEHQVLAHYLAQKEPIPASRFLSPTQLTHDTAHHVIIRTYTMSSQEWPKQQGTFAVHHMLDRTQRHTPFWEHTLVIYQPLTLDTKIDQALLFVNGGTRYPINGKHQPEPHVLPFANIAALTHSIVVDLQDVPNQILYFTNQPYQEDALIAYTWNRYMDHPDTQTDWPVQLPMTKSITRAMDAIQHIVPKTIGSSVHIKHFVVAGISKRGWVTWLAALGDQRVSAIMPIVSDLLNLKTVLNQIYENYQHSWPIAFYDYEQAGIPARLPTMAFDRLTNIVDPMTYLTDDQKHAVTNRLSIPKYIISASGDDFFPPEALNLYVDQLPNNKFIRVVPNQSHRINLDIIGNALLTYYQAILQHETPPHLTWQIIKHDRGQEIIVTTDRAPAIVKLWEAINPQHHDFRLAAHIQYNVTTKHYATNTQHTFHYHLIPPQTGWRASFVEVTFPNNKNNAIAPWVLTTPIYVMGNKTSPQKAS